MKGFAILGDLFAGVINGDPMVCAEDHPVRALPQRPFERDRPLQWIEPWV